MSSFFPAVFIINFLSNPSSPSKLCFFLGSHTKTHAMADRTSDRPYSWRFRSSYFPEKKFQKMPLVLDSH